jgi:hypothetical protein
MSSLIVFTRVKTKLLDARPPRASQYTKSRLHCLNLLRPSGKAKTHCGCLHVDLVLGKKDWAVLPYHDSSYTRHWAIRKDRSHRPGLTNVGYSRGERKRRGQIL